MTEFNEYNNGKPLPVLSIKDIVKNSSLITSLLRKKVERTKALLQFGQMPGDERKNETKNSMGRGEILTENHLKLTPLTQLTLFSGHYKRVVFGLS